MKKKWGKNGKKWKNSYKLLAKKNYRSSVWGYHDNYDLNDIHHKNLIQLLKSKKERKKERREVRKRYN